MRKLQEELFIQLFPAAFVRLSELDFYKYIQALDKNVI